MHTNPIKLIVTDLDGTFLDDTSHVTKKNAQAFQHAVQCGIPVAIASGRLAVACSHIAKEAGLSSCYIIACNGAQWMNEPFGEMVQAQYFSKELYQTCFSILQKYGCAYNIYTPTQLYTYRPMNDALHLQLTHRFAQKGIEMIYQPTAQGVDSSLVLKLLFKPFEDPLAYEKAREELQRIPDIYLTSSSASNTEIMPSGVSKASGIACLAKQLGITMDQVMCFGDFDNDVHMMKHCGYSVVMANGTPLAKQHARFETKRNVEDGVAYAVDHLLAGTIETLRRKE